MFPLTKVDPSDSKDSKAIANLSRKFQKFPPSVKFPVFLQPYLQMCLLILYQPS